MPLPLEGIRVVDVTAVWAGPHCTMLLADWGAEVIRVESIQVLQPSTRGHMARPPKEMPRLTMSWGSTYPDWDPGERPWNRYPIFQSHARNKLSVTADLTTPEGQDLFRQLIRVADVFVENNVPSTIERLHLTYEELVETRPDLIALRMPAYGLSGKYKNYRSYGVQLEGTAGHTWLRGYPDLDPSARDDVYLGDAAAGVSGAFAVLGALRHRRRTGKGQLIEFAQAENFIPYLGEAIMDYTMNGRVHETLGNRHPTKAPNGVYPCKGADRWVTISVGNDAEWRGLRQAMGDPAWAKAPLFSNSVARWKNQDELDRQLTEWTAQRTPDDAVKCLQGAGVPAGAVLDDADLLRDPQINSMNYFKEFTHVDTGTHKYPGLMWSTENVENELRTPPCRLGEHNEAVYKDLLAYSDEEYVRLEELAHIGMDYAPHVL